MFGPMTRDLHPPPAARPLFAGFLLASFLQAGAPAALAQDELERAAAAARYNTCLALADRDARSAYDQAVDWRDHDSGGMAAEHCAAVALARLGQYAEAAGRLEALARDAEPAMAARLYGQAGQAWSMAGETQRAYADQSKAVERAPKDVELLIDRAFTLVEAGDIWLAIDDLSLAAKLAPTRGDILIYRASAYRLTKSLDLARLDVERGLTLNPGDPLGLLERGILKRLRSDPEGAREDWLATIAAAPDSEAAAAARANLERLEIAQ